TCDLLLDFCERESLLRRGDDHIDVVDVRQIQRGLTLIGVAERLAGVEDFKRVVESEGAGKSRYNQHALKIGEERNLGIKHALHARGLRLQNHLRLASRSGREEDGVPVSAAPGAR